MAAVAQGQYPQPVYHIPKLSSHRGYLHKISSNSITGTYKGTNTGLEIIERRNVHFDPIPIPYGQILPYLIQKGMVEPRTLNPVQPPYPPGYDENATCDYHAEII
jgi:hypothetical protein